MNDTTNSAADASVKQFEKNADIMYNRNWFTDKEGIERLVEFTGVGSDEIVAEFACGGGTVAARLAKSARRIIGIDITPRMIELAKKRAESEHLVNANFVVADCYETGLEASSYDLSVMRYALHHFHDPLRVLSEMRRIVGKTDGKIVIEDVLSPSNEVGGFYRNVLERFRDPSHSQMFSLDGLFSLFEISRIKPLKVQLLTISRDFQDWMEQASPSKEKFELCRSVIERDIGRNLTGLDPKLDGTGRLTISLTDVLIRAIPTHE